MAAKGNISALIDMARLINSEMDIRDRAIITLLAKTGIRRNEIISLDVSDVELQINFLEKQNH